MRPPATDRCRPAPCTCLDHNLILGWGVCWLYCCRVCNSTGLDPRIIELGLGGGRQMSQVPAVSGAVGFGAQLERLGAGPLPVLIISWIHTKLGVLAPGRYRLCCSGAVARYLAKREVPACSRSLVWSIQILCIKPLGKAEQRRLRVLALGLLDVTPASAVSMHVHIGEGIAP